MSGIIIVFCALAWTFVLVSIAQAMDGEKSGGMFLGSLLTALVTSAWIYAVFTGGK